MNGFGKSAAVWVVWCGSVGITVIILAWLSSHLVHAERAHQQASIQAENERLALWRMESRLLPLISAESAWNRPSVKSGLHGTDRAKSSTWPATHDFVLGRFHIDADGHVWGDELAQERDASGTLLSASAESISAFLGSLALIPTEALLNELVTFHNLVAPSISHNMVPLDSENLAIVADATAASNQLSQSFRNEIEYINRYQATNSVGVQSHHNFSNNLRNQGSPPVANEQPMISYWFHGHLVLAGALIDGAGNVQSVHGCVLNWPKIQQTLCAEVRDLLPHAQLVAIDNDAAADNSSLAAIPAKLVAGPVADVTLPNWSPMRVSLLVAWLGFLVSALAVGVMLLGLLRLSQRRADFVSAVSHELRTPLTTFQLYTDLLQNGETLSAEKRDRYLATLKRESTRLMNLVDNVLGFSQLEITARDAMIESVCWPDFMLSVREVLQERVRLSDMEICFRDEPAKVYVVANARGLERILFNLVDNSCKYASGRKSREIEVSSQTVGGHLEIRVADHGPGISPSARRRLFQPFSKSATEAARAGQGVGLGLSLSRRLARSMRGDLLVEQSSERGTVFLIRLMRVIAD